MTGMMGFTDLHQFSPLIIDGDTFSPELIRATRVIGLDSEKNSDIAKVMGAISKQDPGCYKGMNLSRCDVTSEIANVTCKTTEAVRLMLLENGEIDVTRYSSSGKNNKNCLILGEDGELLNP